MVLGVFRLLAFHQISDPIVLNLSFLVMEIINCLYTRLNEQPWYISMVLIIFRQELYLILVFRSKVKSFQEFFLLNQALKVLKKQNSWCQIITENIIDIPAVVVILTSCIFVIQYILHSESY